MNRTVIYSVSGLSCAHREMRIQTSVQEIPGMSPVRASFSRRRVEVAFDSGRTTEAAIRDAITSAEYQVAGEGKTRQPGENVIEFTPDQTTSCPIPAGWVCWTKNFGCGRTERNNCKVNLVFCHRKPLKCTYNVVRIISLPVDPRRRRRYTI